MARTKPLPKPERERVAALVARMRSKKQPAPPERPPVLETWLYDPMHCKFCPMVFADRPAQGKFKNTFPEGAVKFGLHRPPFKDEPEYGQYERQHKALLAKYPVMRGLLADARKKGLLTTEGLIEDIEQAMGLKCYFLDKFDRWMPTSVPRRVRPVELEF